MLGNGVDNVGTGFGLYRNVGSQPCFDSLGFTQSKEFDFSQPIQTQDSHQEGSGNVLHSFANVNIADKNMESSKATMPSSGYVLRPRSMPATTL